jgi:thiol-disulfide isomerase/thioredoxin
MKRPGHTLLCLAAVLPVFVGGCARLRSTTSVLAPGTKPPPIEAAGWINGPAPTADQLNGKVVVVDVWAFWCRPCQQAAPGLLRAYNKYKDRGVEFIGLVSEGEDQLPATQAYVDRFRIPWPNGYGADSTIAAWGVTGLPTTVVIGTNGRIAWNDVGWSEDFAVDLDRAIDQALASPSK